MGIERLRGAWQAVLAGVSATVSSVACNVVDDEPGNTSGDGTGGLSGAEVCAEEFAALLQVGCPPGSLPWQEFDGGNSTFVLLDDPAAWAGLGVGLVVHFGAGTGADWAGYYVTQNATCSTACVIPNCQDGQNGCFASFSSGELCSHYCVNEEIDQQACNDLQQTCLASEGDPSADGTAGEGGGLDETGGGETTGGVMDEPYEPYDCGRWHPEAVRQAVPGGAFQVPQVLVDQLVLGNADALAECDGVRLRQTSDGRWVISKMRDGGLLRALGLRVGDELMALDDIELDSLDALVELMGRFVDEDGNPRRFSPNHPGFSLRVRRGGRDFQREVRIVPSTMR